MPRKGLAIDMPSWGEHAWEPLTAGMRDAQDVTVAEALRAHPALTLDLLGVAVAALDA